MSAVVFDLKFPFDFKGEKHTRFEMRRPKVRDLKKFARENEKDAIVAMERVIADLCEVTEVVVQELDLEDFAPMKKAFEDFLNAMANDSAES